MDLDAEITLIYGLAAVLLVVALAAVAGILGWWCCCRKRERSQSQTYIEMVRIHQVKGFSHLRLSCTHTRIWLLRAHAEIIVRVTCITSTCTHARTHALILCEHSDGMAPRLGVAVVAELKLKLKLKLKTKTKN